MRDRSPLAPTHSARGTRFHTLDAVCTQSGSCPFRSARFGHLCLQEVLIAISMGAKRKNTAVAPSAETKAKKPRTSWSEVDDNIIRAYVDKKTAAGEKVSWKDLEAVLERKATRISEHWKNHLDPAKSFTH